MRRNIKKNHFVFIHSLIPAPYFVPKDDPLVFNEDCSMRIMSKNLQVFANDISRKIERPLFGYETNYICMLKRVKEFAEFIRVYDSEAIVIIQGDSSIGNLNGLSIQEDSVIDDLILSPKIFTLVKTSKECKRHLSNQIDNINAIRLILSCATNQKVKLLKKKSFRIDIDKITHNFYLMTS